MNVHNREKLNQKSFNSHILLAIFCMVLLYVYKKTNQKYMYWLNSFIQQCIDIKYFHLIETILTTHASKTSIVHLVKLNLCISLVLLYADGTINDIVLRSVCKRSSFIFIYLTGSSTRVTRASRLRYDWVKTDISCPSFGKRL